MKPCPFEQLVDKAVRTHDLSRGLEMLPQGSRAAMCNAIIVKTAF
jgi:hypothetical protein